MMDIDVPAGSEAPASIAKVPASTDIAPTSIDKAASEISMLCNRIEEIATAIATAQREQLQASSDAQQQLIGEVTGIFVRLRLLHRQLNEDKVDLTASVDKLKRDTDSLALELENKQREVRYIQGEIESTTTLETIYQDIELISIDEFMQSAPDEFKSDIGTPHKLMLARLRYEVKQRDMLMEVKATAKARRDELRLAKRKRIERLEKIDGHLQGFIKSVKLLDRSLTANGSGAQDETMGDESKPGHDGVDERKDAKPSRSSRGNSSRVGTPRA
ncbi:hypothetical protein GGH96_003577 [Coemansia sp. RSA 1972]|nr:hypothetical protein GGH96_003577 [Coemansia sp. RSA 1972]